MISFAVKFSHCSRLANSTSFTYSDECRKGLVYDDTVSGALETAAIAPSGCRPPPPAADRHPIAPCGIVLTASGIASPSRLFCRLPLPPQPVRCIYIARPRFLERPLTFSSLFPLLPFSPGALPSFQDTALPDDCTFSVWRAPFLSFRRPLFFLSAPTSPTGHLNGFIEN